jgi:O-acetyl-ADP-ribose deacetylase (regulator of RNase III)
MKQEALHYSAYAKEIKLFSRFRTNSSALSGPEKEQLLDILLEALKERARQFGYLPHLAYKEKRRILHAVLNTLPPATLNNSQVALLDQLLQSELAEKKLCGKNELEQSMKLCHGNTNIVVWQGDICTLEVDAIVNAANSQLLGCFLPLHACIDNSIHSAAGVQLRDDCYTIMQKQGFSEPTGTAKITRAYNLPSKFVLHTVGPIVSGELTEQNQKDLADAYSACLEISKELTAIKSLAFCGISTGVFGYPAHKAAKLALKTVSSWLKHNPDNLDILVFNVFSDSDKKIYSELLEQGKLDPE